MGFLRGEDYKGRIDSNRWFYCKHCGFLVDTLRFQVGDGSGSIAVMTTVPVDSGTIAKTVYFDSFDQFGTVETDYSPDGSVRNKKHETAYEVAGGCPLCGSRNYKGEKYG